MDTNSKEFKKLQAKWYKKLADTGFEEIEQTDGMLKHWASKHFKVGDDTTKHIAKEEYYRLAGQFLYDHKFENPLERNIWKMHSEGMSSMDIVNTLKGKKVKIYNNKVKKIRKKLESLMVIKFTGKDE